MEGLLSMGLTQSSFMSVTLVNFLTPEGLTLWLPGKDFCR